MCAMAMFTACSDDDDDFKGNGEGVGSSRHVPMTMMISRVMAKVLETAVPALW